MIRLVFSGRPSMRFAFSPIWEALSGARALRGRDRVIFPEARARGAERALASRRMEALWAVVDARTGYLPGFLAPPPGRPLTKIEEDLAAVRATPEARVRRELAHAAELAGSSGARIRVWLDRPAAYLEAVCRAIRSYWECVLEPRWGEHRQVLEGEVVARGRELALYGPERVLDALGPGVCWRAGAVEVECGALERTEDVQGGLVLVPSVHMWPKVFVGGGERGLEVVYYPARGAAGLLLEPEASSGALADLLGATRAAVLLGLREPATTTELAGRMSLAAATVSEHLGRLADAGLVDRNRVGRRVYYRLNPRGVELVRLFPE